MDITSELKSMLQFVFDLCNDTQLFVVAGQAISLWDIIIGSMVVFFLVGFINYCVGGGLVTWGSNGRHLRASDFPKVKQFSRGMAAGKRSDYE